MTSSTDNRSANVPHKDPVDILIFEKGLRIKTVLPVKDLDMLVVVLNNGRIIKTKLSAFKLLRDATEGQLAKWELRLGGAAIRWDELDEDLSLRGFITNNLMGGMLRQLENKDAEAAGVI